MATRAPQLEDVLTAKHLGAPAAGERNRTISKDDPLLRALLGAPLATELTEDDLQAVEEFRRMKRVVPRGA